MVKKINIYGPSGSGKTRFVTENAFAGMQFITKFENILEYKISVSILPLSTFEGSVELYLRMFGFSNQEIQKEIDELTQLLGVDEENILDRFYLTLSAGERRRLDIFRCVKKSRCVIIDEPFSNSSKSYYPIISNFIEKNCENIIFLNHDVVQNYQNIHINNLIELKKTFDINNEL